MPADFPFTPPAPVVDPIPARARSAYLALQRYAQERGEPLEWDHLPELLCDLMHLVKRAPFRAAVFKAGELYEAEWALARGFTVTPGMARPVRG